MPTAGAGKEVGSSGLRIGGGQVLEEEHPHLVGREALKKFRTMKDNEPVIGAILFTIDALVRQTDWRVEQGDAKEADAEFLESNMEDMSMSWGDVVSEAFSMVPFGFSTLEICYKKRQGPQPPGSKTPGSKYDDGKIGWRKLPLRAQESLDHWEFDDEGGIQAFVQRPAPDYQAIEIPMEKILLFRTTSHKNNPEGRSLLRSAYKAYFRKKRIEEIEGTGIERDLAGFPVFWLPQEYLADDAPDDLKRVAAAFAQIGQNIRRDKQEFLMMPLVYDENGNKAFDFTLTASAGTRTFDLNAVIGRYNQELAMSLLADFILLGHEKVGSFALSSDKTDLFATALGTFLDVVEDVFNRFAIPRLFALNGMDLKNLPQIKHGDIESPDLTALSAYLGALFNAGMPLFPDEDLEDYLRKAAGLPEKSEEAKEAQALKDQQAQAAAQAQTEGVPGGSGQEAPGAGGAGDDGGFGPPPGSGRNSGRTSGSPPRRGSTDKPGAEGSPQPS